jgi:ribokinase
MMAISIFCLGAVNLDLLYEIDDLSPFQAVWPDLQPGGEVALTGAGETHLQEILTRQARFRGRCGGGQAANTALALARMGLSAGLIGRVGADPDGAFLKEELAGVNLNYLTMAGVSGRAYILVDQGGERTILVAPNTNDHLSLAGIPWEALAQARFLHLTSFVGEGPPAVQYEVARRLGEGDFLGRSRPGGPDITLDPGELYARRGRRALDPLLDWLDTLFVTEREWQLWDGPLFQYAEWAPPVTLIKRGSKGVRLIVPKHYQDFPAEPAPHLVDTLGAGDVFAAGYLAARVLKLHLKQAVMLGLRAAAMSLRGQGRESYPDQEFLERELDRLSY